MHELAITENILNIALEHAQQASATRITDLYIVVGQLSSIVDDSVQFYWDIISRETLAEGATLHFQREPARIVCQTCQQESNLSADFICPRCGGLSVKVVSGDQFYVEAIEIQ